MRDNLGGVVMLVLMAVLLVLAVIALVSPRRRRDAARAAAWCVGLPVALYLVGRGVAEFFTVDFGNAASYQNDWGGPSLAGVLLVHAGPGLLILFAAAVLAWRRAARPRRG